MPVRGRQFVVAILLALCGSVSATEPMDVEPKIPPGYSPEQGDDEKGLWLEMEEYEKAIRSSALLIKDPDLTSYVRNAACRVAGDYCNDLRVYLIRNPGFNASMAPNGMMQVWTGLLLRVSSEDELATVLGHELAHYTRLHTLDRLRRIEASLAAGSILDLGLAVFAGIPIPAGQMAAVADAMAFSQQQEEEADLLGVRFMADAKYDPNASYRVWDMLIEEDEKAAAKRQKPGIFSKTHPDSPERARTLRQYVDAHYGSFPDDANGRARHVEILNRHYMVLMEDQIDTNRFGRTQAMLERHAQIGVNKGLIDFFYGEMYRQRDQPGDRERAKEAYLSAIQHGDPPPAAYRNLGYLYLKEHDMAQARTNLKQYLLVDPNASDREMIEFYLEEE